MWLHSDLERSVVVPNDVRGHLISGRNQWLWSSEGGENRTRNEEGDLVIGTEKARQRLRMGMGVTGRPARVQRG